MVYLTKLAESCKDQSTINLGERLKLHREMMNNYGGTSTLGRNSHSRSGISNIHADIKHPGCENLSKRGIGVEIEPPSLMEYHNSTMNSSTYSNNTYVKNKITSMDNMKESLCMGNAKKASKFTQNKKTATLISSESDTD